VADGLAHHQGDWTHGLRRWRREAQTAGRTKPRGGGGDDPCTTGCGIDPARSLKGSAVVSSLFLSGRGRRQANPWRAMGRPGASSSFTGRWGRLAAAGGRTRATVAEATVTAMTTGMRGCGFVMGRRRGWAARMGSCSLAGGWRGTWDDGSASPGGMTAVPGGTTAPGWRYRGMAGQRRRDAGWRQAAEWGATGE